MSQENVEIVRRFVHALNGATQDAPADLEEALTYVEPDIIWNPIEEPPTQGQDAVRAYWERWESEWDVYEEIPEECVDIGDRVVATLLIRGRGRGSGIEIEDRFYEVYTLRDGKIVRMDEFPDHAEALEAAGLSE